MGEGVWLQPCIGLSVHGQEAGELEIERLRREGTKLKAEQDIVKKAAAYLREGSDMMFVFIIAKHWNVGRWHGYAKQWADPGRASMPG